MTDHGAVPLCPARPTSSSGGVVFLLAVLAQLSARTPEHDRERGDVPGWVLITLMTAGIVTVLWAFAGPRLLEILTEALAAVSPA